MAFFVDGRPLVFLILPVKLRHRFVFVYLLFFLLIFFARISMTLLKMRLNSFHLVSIIWDTILVSLHVLYTDLFVIIVGCHDLFVIIVGCHDLFVIIVGCHDLFMIIVGYSDLICDYLWVPWPICDYRWVPNDQNNITIFKKYLILHVNPLTSLSGKLAHIQCWRWSVIHYCQTANLTQPSCNALYEEKKTNKLCSSFRKGNQGWFSGGLYAANL